MTVLQIYMTKYKWKTLTMIRYTTLVLAVLKFLMINIVVFAGKLLALVYTPLIFPLRFYGQNAVFNFSINKGWKIDRLEQVRHLYTDMGDRYTIAPYPAQESTGGYLMKRDVGYLEALLAYVFIYVWVDSDAYLDVTSKFIALRDFKAIKISKTSMVLDGQLVDFGATIKTRGGYWLCGDAMRENDVPYFSSFKAMYMWTCVRNGFYGFNYTFLESFLEKYSKNPDDWEVDVIKSNREYDDIRNKSIQLKTDVRADGDTWVTRSGCHWGHEVTVSRIGWNPFFSIMGAKVVDNGDGTYSGKGWELGWRRFGSSVARVYSVKADESDYIAYKKVIN